MVWYSGNVSRGGREVGGGGGGIRMPATLPVILFEVLRALPSHFQANVGSYVQTRQGHFLKIHMVRGSDLSSSLLLNRPYRI
jgi:hypothetical protein